MKRFFLTYLCVLASLCAAYGGSRGYVRRHIVSEFSIKYVVDSTDINENYMGNRAQLDSIRSIVSRMESIDSIVIYSWASPEGSYKHNKYLAKERGITAREFLLKTFEEENKVSPEKIILNPEAENWAGLIKLVEENYQRHDREKVLKILKDESIGDETRKWRLKRLDNGYTWSFLVRRYMPDLRAATWICVWAKLIEPLPELKAIGQPLQCAPGTIRIPEVKPVEKITEPVDSVSKEQRTVIGLKTNMLYDAVTALNYAIEVPFNEKFSLQFQQHTPWWLTKSNKHCLQFLSLGGEFRWWFAPRTSPATEDRKLRDALMGHYLGVYGFSGKADVQWGRDFGCYQFEFVSGGLTYGYSMPIGKYLNLEFSISAGYARIPYQHYIPTDDWQILIRDKNNAGTLHYFGPTKAEISLVIPIRANINRKGGAR